MPTVRVEPARLAWLQATTASVAVLRKAGFTRTAEIDDPEDGSIWRWELPTP